jgi:hypothetical protein
MGWGWAMDGMDYMTWVAGNPTTGLDPTTMQQYVDAALASNAILIAVLLVFFLLVAGLIVLAVGLHRAGVLRGWLAWLMPVGMPGMASFLEFPVPLVISALALLASFGVVGVKLLRAPDRTLEALPV